MKILIGCLNANGLGGSEMYNYELSRELSILGHDVTLFTLRDIIPNDITRINLSKFNVKQIDRQIIDYNVKYDIIIASQPEVNMYMNNKFNIPIISVIHSEIRSEEPIMFGKNKSIMHYVAIRKPIYDMLINQFGIPESIISLIYNPIDTNRFNSNNRIQKEKVSGIFVGEVLDNIRFKPIQHIANECIKSNMDLYIMSESRYDFNHPNIKYLDKRWDTENIVKHMDFTAGILLGRTTLEGWCCGIPGYMYIIDKYGDILNIETEKPENIISLCDSKYVAKQILNLIETLI